MRVRSGCRIALRVRSGSTREVIRHRVKMGTASVGQVGEKGKVDVNSCESQN